MNKWQSYIWWAITVVFAAWLVRLTLYQIVLRPGHIIPELGTDGAKNSFTYLYECMFGKGYWFNGMNYPYGEHIVYTDGQPLLSVPLSYFKNVTSGDALTVMWLLISFSLFLSILVIYRILIHFRLHPLAAMLFAGLIGIFSPQLFRIHQGHYALSYTCVIPMLFFWTIKYLEGFRWRYPLYFFITGCLMSFLHPYYAAMMLVWVMCFTIGYFILVRKSFAQKIKYTFPLLGSVIMVLAVVAIVMKATDPITDRPANPLNTFYETCTHIKQIVTSFASPIWQKGVRKPRFHFVSTGGEEGYAYIGLVIGITVAVSLVVGFIRSVRQKKLDIIADTKVFSPIWLFMALAALLFGMGVPFTWHMEWLFDYVSFFRQFRSLGRFSWIFYYIIAIYTAVVIYTVYARYMAKRKIVAGYTVLLLALGLWSYEASGYVDYYRWRSWLGIYNYDKLYSSGEKSWSVFLDEHHYGANNFQALLALPYFHVGTEKLWVGDGSWLIYLASKACLQLHMPMVDAMMSRSSWSVAMKQVKIAGGPYVEKPMLKDIKSNKPFLLLQFGEKPLNPDQEYLLQASDYIGNFSQCEIYACYPTRIAANDKRNADSVEKILPVMKHADTVIANDGICYYDHFDAATGNQHIFGTGGGPVIHGNDTILATIPMTIIPRDSELYEFSCWFLVTNKDYRTPYVTVQLLNDSGRVVGYPDALTKQSTDNKGMWLRSSVFFYVHRNCRSINFKLMNVPNPAYLAMDEILLRPAGALVISKAADGQVMVNNHLFTGNR